MGKVEAYIAVELVLGSFLTPAIAEESLKEGSVYRNIVAWQGGELKLSREYHVKKFWHGTVGCGSGRSSAENELETAIVGKNEQIKKNVQLIRDNELKLGEKNKFISCLEEDVRCKACLRVPNSAPLHNCSTGHILCHSCFKGPESPCPSCKKEMGSAVSLIGLTVIERIKHTCMYPNCMAKVDFSSLAEHRQTCSFRPILCPAVKCKKELSYDNVLRHLLYECQHSWACGASPQPLNIDSTSDATTVNLVGKPETTDWKMITHCWGEKYFFLTVGRINNRMRNVYVQMLGTGPECLKYKVRMSFKDKDGHELFSHHDHPFPIHMEEEDKVDGGLIITTKNLRNAGSPHGPDVKQVSLLIQIEFEEI